MAADGTAFVQFSNTSLANVVATCWISQDAVTWLQVAFHDNANGVSCGATTNGPNLVVAVINAPPGWILLVTAATAP